MSSEETRIVNPVTGGEKGSKLERYDLVPVKPLEAVARHYGVGARKYEDRNWERGYDWSLSYAAAQRHLNQFWNGEDYDEETGSCHLAAVVFHCFALMEFMDTHPELDNRPKVHEPSVDVVEVVELTLKDYKGFQPVDEHVWEDSWKKTVDRAIDKYGWRMPKFTEVSKPMYENEPEPQPVVETVPDEPKVEVETVPVAQADLQEHTH